MKAASFLILAVSLQSSLASANDSERKYLSELEEGLVALSHLIDKAEASANENDEYVVAYQEMKSQYFALVRGIKEVVEAPRREPRLHDDKTEINGRYLQ